MATITLHAAHDTYVRQSSPSTNYEGDSYLVLGKTGSSSQVDRVLLGFDFAPLMGKIVDEAVLWLYQDDSAYATTAALNFTARRVAQSWNAGSVTWNTQPANAEPAAAMSLSGNANGWRSFPMTAMLHAIASQRLECRGLLLRQADESQSDRRKNFFSAEYGSGGGRRAYIAAVYHDMPVWCFVGGAWRRGVSMAAAPGQGPLGKAVTGIKTAPVKGAVNKTAM